MIAAPDLRLLRLHSVQVLVLNNIVFALSTYKMAFLLHFGLVSLRDEGSLLAPLLVGRLQWFQLWLREFCQCLLNG